MTWIENEANRIGKILCNELFVYRTLIRGRWKVSDDRANRVNLEITKIYMHNLLDNRQGPIYLLSNIQRGIGAGFAPLLGKERSHAVDFHS